MPKVTLDNTTEVRTDTKDNSLSATVNQKEYREDIQPHLSKAYEVARNARVRLDAVEEMRTGASTGGPKWKGRKSRHEDFFEEMLRLHLPPDQADQVIDQVKEFMNKNGGSSALQNNPTASVEMLRDLHRQLQGTSQSADLVISTLSGAIGLDSNHLAQILKAPDSLSPSQEPEVDMEGLEFLTEAEATQSEQNQNPSLTTTTTTETTMQSSAETAAQIKQMAPELEDLAEEIGTLEGEILRAELDCNPELNVEESRKKLAELRAVREERLRELQDSPEQKLLLQQLNKIEEQAHLVVALKTREEVVYRNALHHEFNRHGGNMKDPDSTLNKFNEIYSQNGFLKTESLTANAFAEVDALAKERATASIRLINTRAEGINRELDETFEDLEDIQALTKGINSHEMWVLRQHVSHSRGESDILAVMHEEIVNDNTVKKFNDAFYTSNRELDFSHQNIIDQYQEGSLLTLKEEEVRELDQIGMGDRLLQESLDSPNIELPLVRLRRALGPERLESIALNNPELISTSLQRIPDEAKRQECRQILGIGGATLTLEQETNIIQQNLLRMEQQRAIHNAKIGVVTGSSSQMSTQQIDSWQRVLLPETQQQNLTTGRTEVYQQTLAQASRFNLQRLAEINGRDRGDLGNRQVDTEDYKVDSSSYGYGNRENRSREQLDQYRANIEAVLQNSNLTTEQVFGERAENGQFRIEADSIKIGEDYALEAQKKTDSLDGWFGLSGYDAVASTLEGIHLNHNPQSTFTVQDNLDDLGGRFLSSQGQALDAAIRDEYSSPVRETRILRLYENDFIGAQAARMHELDADKMKDDDLIRQVIETTRTHSGNPGIRELEQRLAETGEMLNKQNFVSVPDANGNYTLQQVDRYHCKTLQAVFDQNINDEDLKRGLEFMTKADCTVEDADRASLIMRLKSYNGFWNDKEAFVIRDLQIHFDKLLETSYQEYSKTNAPTDSSEQGLRAHYQKFLDEKGNQAVATEVAELDRISGGVLKSDLHEALADFMGGKELAPLTSLLKDHSIKEFDRNIILYLEDNPDNKDRRELVSRIASNRGSEYFYELNRANHPNLKTNQEVDQKWRRLMGKDSQGGDRYNVLLMAMEEGNANSEIRGLKAIEPALRSPEQVQRLQEAEYKASLHRDAIFLWESMAGLGTENEDQIVDIINTHKNYGTLDELSLLFNNKEDPNALSFGVDLKTWASHDLGDGPPPTTIPGQEIPGGIEASNRHQYEVLLSFQMAEEAKYQPVLARADLLVKESQMRLGYYSQLNNPMDIIRSCVGLESFNTKDRMIQNANRVLELHEKGADLSEIQSAYTLSRSSAFTHAEAVERNVELVAEGAAIVASIAATTVTFGASAGVTTWLLAARLAAQAAAASMVTRTGVRAGFTSGTSLNSSQLLSDAAYSFTEGVATVAGFGMTRILASRTQLLSRAGFALENTGQAFTHGSGGIRRGGLVLLEESPELMGRVCQNAGYGSLDDMLRNASFTQIREGIRREGGAELLQRLDRELLESALHYADETFMGNLKINLPMQLSEEILGAPIYGVTESLMNARENGILDGNFSHLITGTYDNMVYNFYGCLVFQGAVGLNRARRAVQTTVRDATFSVLTNRPRELVNRHPRSLGREATPELVDRMLPRIHPDGIAYLRRMEDLNGGFVTRGDLMTAMRVDQNTSAKRLVKLEERHQGYWSGRQNQNALEHRAKFDEDLKTRADVDSDSPKSLREKMDAEQRARADEDFEARNKKRDAEADDVRQKRKHVDALDAHRRKSDGRMRRCKDLYGADLSMDSNDAESYAKNLDLDADDSFLNRGDFNKLKNTQGLMNDHTKGDFIVFTRVTIDGKDALIIKTYDNHQLVKRDIEFLSQGEVEDPRSKKKKDNLYVFTLTDQESQELDTLVGLDRGVGYRFS